MSGTDLRRLLVTIDGTAVVASWLLVSTVGIDDPAARDAATGRATIHELTILLLLVAAAYVLAQRQGLYLSRVARDLTLTAVRWGRVAAVLGLAGAVLMPAWSLSRAAAFGVVTFVTLLVGRDLFQRWVDRQRTAGRYTTPVLVVGPASERSMLVDLLRFHPETGFRVVGLVGDPPAKASLDRESPEDRPEPPWLGPTVDTLEAARSVGAAGAIVVANALPANELNALLRQWVDAGLHVHLSSGLWGLGPRRLHWSPLAHERLMYVEPTGLSPVQEVAKRCLDIVIASLALVIAAPVLALAALATRIADGTPVLFRQERVGRDGTRFTLLKLRTMETDAESHLPALEHRNERQGGPLFKLDHDPRVTRIGHLLRLTSIDELPQLVNVIRGELSLVGPRPALPAEADRFDDVLLQRQRVRPGVTGLWQVEARDNPAFFVYRQLDLYYVENWSISLDLAILVATIPAVIGRCFWGLRNREKGNETVGLDLRTRSGAASLDPRPVFDPDEIAV
jgi:exopolysaccharide biosynthesis polyprenyl glycosylphosphotransferase